MLKKQQMVIKNHVKCNYSFKIEEYILSFLVVNNNGKMLFCCGRDTGIRCRPLCVSYDVSNYVTNEFGTIIMNIEDAIVNFPKDVVDILLFNLHLIK